MADEFNYDVFLSHSSKDKDIVRPLAERLRADGLRVWFDEWVLKPGDSIPAKIEEGLEQSRVLVLCMSAQAFGSDWAQLEAGTFMFRDPLNQERRFIPLRLDAAPIKGTLAQRVYINWLPEAHKQEYAKLFNACRPFQQAEELEVNHEQFTKEAFSRGQLRSIYSVAVSPDNLYGLTGSAEGTVRFREIASERCLRLLSGHTGGVLSVALSVDGRYALSGSGDTTVRVWELETGRCLHILRGSSFSITGVAWSGDGQYVLSADSKSLRLWEVTTARCLHTWGIPPAQVLSVALNSDGQFALSGAEDKTLRLWEVTSGQCLRVLQGHTGSILSVALSSDGRHALTGSNDKTIRLWEVMTGRCLHVLKGHRSPVWTVAWSTDQHHALTGDQDGVIKRWDLSEFVTGTLLSTSDEVQYTNAKVLLVGDTSSGKTGLAHRLATGGWKPSDGSTVGAWSTQWSLPVAFTNQKDDRLEREIWLWDFGGQADQRLVHQLYMDRTALILLLFDADKEDVLPGMREWQTALRRCVPSETPLVLVAGRIDAGFRANRAKLQQFAQEQGFRYFETSAKDGTNCDELSRAITEGIPWVQMEKCTSPRIFKLIKDQILKLRDEGEVLLTYKELREKLWQRLADEPRFDDATLQTVIGLLDGPGAVKELDYGTYILLQPEWVNAYAQAVIRTLRQDPTELGCLPLRSIAEGRLLFQTVERDGNIAEMKRLAAADERVVLREMERQLEERGLCLRQGDKLVFPSHCGRERPAVVEHPAVFVSYAVQGYLDDIYATLVVKLADSESFKLKELWRDAADFVTLAGAHHMGIKLTRAAASHGDISVYFAPGVTKQEQVIFANYIDAHLQGKCEAVQRLRSYVCPYCHAPKGNPQVLMQKLLAKKTKATVVCDSCDESFGLWDELERRFASEAVRQQVEGMQAEDAIRLDSRRKGKLLALEVAARIASADQKCFEIPATKDEGLDMELEFTDDDGKGTGQRLYLQLKSGNSQLEWDDDGREMFEITEPRWVDYWLKQPHPVMLVIGTFATDEERGFGKDKLEFADVRWMEISSVLQRESDGGKKAVKQIEFKGERLDMTSVRRWRERMLQKS